MLDDSRTLVHAEPASTLPAEAKETAVGRFRSCKWYDKVEGGTEYCTHVDVLPYAGKTGFTANAWCFDCAFYKIRRAVNRRNQDLDNH